MRFDYWTVRVIPRPMGITSIGVGVIVFDPRSGQSSTKFHPSSRLYSDSEYSEAITHALGQFKTELHNLSASSHGLDLGQGYSLPGYLSFLNGHWMNLVRVDQVQSMDAADINVATDLLYSVLIGDSPAQTSRPSVTQIRSKIRRVYGEFEHLGQSTVDDVSIEVFDREIDLNVAVIDDADVLEVNQAFNFQTADTKAIQSLTDSWTLKVDKVQSHGGVLITPRSKFEVDEALHFVAVVQMPETASQNKIFQQFAGYCHDLKIDVIDQTTIWQHAERLEQRIA